MRGAASRQAIPAVLQGTEAATVAAEATVGVVSGGIILRGHHGRTLALVEEPAGISERRQCVLQTRKKEEKQAASVVATQAETLPGAAVFVLLGFYVGSGSGPKGGRSAAVLGTFVAIVLAAIVRRAGVSAGTRLFTRRLSRVGSSCFTGLDSAEQR